MNFGDALYLLKSGRKLFREGWSGTGQYVVLQKGYPHGIEINANTAEATGLREGSVQKFAPYLMTFNAQGVFVPWVATQGDLLAEDWAVVPSPPMIT